jgi:hypothetical protein
MTVSHGVIFGPYLVIVCGLGETRSNILKSLQAVKRVFTSFED